MSAAQKEAFQPLGPLPAVFFRDERDHRFLLLRRKNLVVIGVELQRQRIELIRGRGASRNACSGFSTAAPASGGARRRRVPSKEIRKQTLCVAWDDLLRCESRPAFTAWKVAGTLRVPSAEADTKMADGTRSEPATLSLLRKAGWIERASPIDFLLVTEVTSPGVVGLAALEPTL